MAGERDLRRLIDGLQPSLDPRTYVFVTAGGPLPTEHPAVIASFREDEGLTLIAQQSWAEAEGLEASFPCRRITLNVHSSLEAVGLMAAVSSALAQQGIAANPVSAFYHDHLFVPVQDAERALMILKGLSGHRPAAADAGD